MNHINALIDAHLGRTQFCTEREFEQIAGRGHLEKVLQEFGTWELACEYLRNHWKFDLEMPFSAPHVPKHIADILYDFRKISKPADFSTIPHVKEALVACLKNFYDTHGFVPTIDEAKGKYASYFPDVYHYIETFGTWHNACKNLPDMKPEEIPNFGQELKTTVNYYNRKFGRTLGMLMLEKDWNKMVEQLGKAKDVPNASRIIDYVAVDRESRGTGMPQNGWQAVAEKANLDVDRRGRPQEFARLYDRDKIMKNYVGACVKNGHILTLQGWKVHCISTSRGYRPPDSKTIKELFGSIEHLQLKAAQHIQANKRMMAKYMAMKEIAAAENNIAAARYGTAKENDIWETIKNLSANETAHEAERDRFLH